LSLLTAATAITVVALAWVVPTLERARRAYNESSSILSDMLTAIRSSLKEQQEKILDNSVRLDILEERLKSIPQRDITRRVSEPALRHDITQPSTNAEAKEVVGPYGLARADKDILTILQNGPRTVAELRTSLGRSREHIARLMKRLYDQGLVTRSSTMPYMYTLTDKAKQYVRSG